MPTPPAWYEIALEELAASVAERGSGAHPRILEYLATCTDLEEGEWERDSTPWCSAFVNWCLAQAGIEGTDSGWARSWAQWGEPIDPPRLGAVAVWARGRASPEEPVVTGHVAFFVEDLGDSLRVLGGQPERFRLSQGLSEAGLPHRHGHLRSAGSASFTSCSAIAGRRAANCARSAPR